MRIAEACFIGAVVTMQCASGRLARSRGRTRPSRRRGASGEKAAFSPRDTAEDVVFGGKMWNQQRLRAGGKLVRDLWSSSMAPRGSWSPTTRPTTLQRDGRLRRRIWRSGQRLELVRRRELETGLQKTPFGRGVTGVSGLPRPDVAAWHGKDVWNTRDGVNWECVSADNPFGPATGPQWRSTKTNCGSWAAQPLRPRPPEKHYPKYTTPMTSGAPRTA